MKKIFRLFAAFAATTMAFSCMEEANPETGVQNGGSKYEGPMTTITFAVEELETKTAWDGENHTWSDGDQIKIVYGTEDDAFEIATISDGKVTATVGDVDTYYAVYPAETSYVLEIAEGASEPQFSVTIPDGQDGSFKQANIMAAKTSKEAHVFAFKNMTHIFKFYKSENSEFNGFRFLTNSSSNILLKGTYPVTFNEDGSIEMGTPTNQSRYISCVGLKGTGPFYIGIGPGVNMDYGFAVMGTRSNKNTEWEETALTTGKVITERSAITNIDIELDKVLHKDWYIKEEATGNGDGTSWDNAGDITTLLKLIGNEIADGVSYNGNTNCLRLNNANIYIAEGEYDIPTAIGSDYLNLGDAWGYDKKDPTHKTIIWGGYPATATGKDIATRDIDAHPTKLVNPYKAQNNRLFSINGKTIPDLTFDGITFTKSSEAGDIDTGRGRIMLCTKAKGKITFNDCRFTGLNTSNNMGASAIDIRQASASEFVMNFTGCKFIDNHTTNAYTYGGVIMLEPDTEKVTVNITQCTFESNSTAVAKSGDKSRGGAIFIAAGTVNVKESIFKNNTSANLGGAIYADRNAILNISQSNFEANTASYGGAIHTSGITYSIENSSFNSNSARRGGAISNEIGILKISGCNFIGNGHTNNACGGAILSYDEYPHNESDSMKNTTVKEGEIAQAYIYNSYFKDNFTTDASAGQGASIQVHGHGKLAAVNSTFAEVPSSKSGGAIRARGSASSTSTLYIISCTMNNTTGQDFFLQQGTGYVYNSLILGAKMNTGGSAEYKNSITATSLWIADGSKSEETVVFANQIGAYANGVFPVASGSAAATNGMTSDALSALATTITAEMPLFDATKLTVDQKGNSRVGKTVMGAYVGE